VHRLGSRVGFPFGNGQINHEANWRILSQQALSQKTREDAGALWFHLIIQKGLLCTIIVCSISISMSFWRFLRFIGAAIIKGNSELWGDADLYRVHEYGMDSAVHDF